MSSQEGALASRLCPFATSRRRFCTDSPAFDARTDPDARTSAPMSPRRESDFVRMAITTLGELHERMATHYHYIHVPHL